jgi:putative transposase
MGTAAYLLGWVAWYDYAMPRVGRLAPGGVIHHVLNRAVGGATLFRSRKDYESFQRCLIETLAIVPMRALGYCVMPNHWHLLLWPRGDGDLARFMMRLTNTHVRRWLTAHNQVGSGHLYQGRYRSFAMQTDDHLLTVGRYIERNALRANLVRRAEVWPWCGIGQAALPLELRVPLSDWPIRRPDDWVHWINTPQTAAEQDAIRQCIKRGRPFGNDNWIRQTMGRLGWKDPGKPGRPAIAKRRRRQ